MLDFNSRGTIADQIKELIDSALTNLKETKRTYLGASMLGGYCIRALQYQYAHTPKDEDKGFSGKILRIFQAGHVFEDLAIGWLRAAGIELRTQTSGGEQFGFSVLGGKIQGHVDGIIVRAPVTMRLKFPMLWECKSLNSKSWKDTQKRGVVLSKPVYAAQIAIYQAYMETVVEGISKNPCLFTAINKDTAEIHHELVPFDQALAQRTSDKAVQIIQATENHELLPRCASTPTFSECKMCSWADRCWKDA
jgi:hypothetical protein